MTCRASWRLSQTRRFYAEGVSNAYKETCLRIASFVTGQERMGTAWQYYALDETGRKETGNPVIEQVDRNINFNWGAAPFYNQQLGDDYKVEWTGYARADKSDLADVLCGCARRLPSMD